MWSQEKVLIRKGSYLGKSMQEVQSSIRCQRICTGLLWGNQIVERTSAVGVVLSSLGNWAGRPIRSNVLPVSLQRKKFILCCSGLYLWIFLTKGRLEEFSKSEGGSRLCGQSGRKTETRGEAEDRQDENVKTKRNLIFLQASTIFHVWKYLYLPVNIVFQLTLFFLDIMFLASLSFWGDLRLAVHCKFLPAVIAPQWPCREEKTLLCSEIVSKMQYQVMRTGRYDCQK